MSCSISEITQAGRQFFADLEENLASVETSFSVSEENLASLPPYLLPFSRPHFIVSEIISS